MATTWRTATVSPLPLDYKARIFEGPATPTSFEFRRTPEGFQYSVAIPGAGNVTLPIQAIVGGTRHGLSFLARLDQLDGIALQRPALIEARYVYNSAQKSLVLSPDSVAEQHASYSAALGSALSRIFEQKCLTCHGEPNTLGAGKEGGVRCESCHGPGWEHLKAAGKGNPRQGIINPNRLAADQQLEVCARCHTGFTHFSDPLPDDLLVSNQVTALRNSECFVQSGKSFACTACHDPHGDAAQIGRANV